MGSSEFENELMVRIAEVEQLPVLNVAVEDALEEIVAGAKDPDEVKDEVRQCFSFLKHEIYFEKPSDSDKEYTEIELRTNPNISGRTNVGKIYVSGKLELKEIHNLEHLAGVAGRHIDYAEQREKLKSEQEFRAEIESLMRHDLTSPAGIIEMYGPSIRDFLEEVEKERDLSKRLEQYINPEGGFRKGLKVVLKNSRLVINLIKMLGLSGLSPEEFRQKSEVFSPFQTLRDIFAAYTHDIITSGKGVVLLCPENQKDILVKTNTGAFTTVFGNLTQNALKYSLPERSIDCIAQFDNNYFIFELENYIDKQIDTNELIDIFKRGYRLKRDSENRPVSSQNEGFGLYFLNKVVKQGFGGEVEVYSGFDKKLSINSSLLGFDRKYYGVNFDGRKDNLDEQFPVFYTRILIPRNSLRLDKIKTERHK